MSVRLSTNIAELGLFQRDLDAFEQALPINSVSPSKFRVAGGYLEIILNRISLAAPADGYQMMRLFALRYLDTHRPYFNAYNVLMAITASNDGKFKQLAMPVLYEMASLLLGNGYLTNDVWFNSVNRLECVKLFFDTCAQAGLRLFQNPSIVNVSNVTQRGEEIDWYSPTCQLKLGVNNPKAVLSQFAKPYLTFVKDPALTEPSNIILAEATITAKTGSFILASQTILTTTALTLLQWANALSTAYVPGNATEINLPGPLHSCELRCISVDAGATWKVVNVQFIAPREIF